jgi:hypothetical protein
MAELHAVSALRNKRAELAGMVSQLEQQLARQRTNLAHLDATMRLFDPDIRPQEIRAKQQRTRSAWFRQCTHTYGRERHARIDVQSGSLALRSGRKGRGHPIGHRAWAPYRAQVDSPQDPTTATADGAENDHTIGVRGLSPPALNRGMHSCSYPSGGSSRVWLHRLSRTTVGLSLPVGTDGCWRGNIRM